jgi:hypothetical protein
MENYRYAPISENSTVMGDEPVKNQAVHICAALEYLATGIRNDSMFQSAAMNRAGQTADTLGAGLTYLS